ncbi:MAG TPA: SDR family oxidoreductase [Rhodocyclaceae bacterium]|nr:SDR family oxidoreductase [Rhodocyclaceae bacterium]
MTALRVFITGASSGIGAALAQHYAAQGATLGLVARSSEKLSALVASLPNTHYTYLLDVMDAAALAMAAQDFLKHAGRPDIVIANAGISVGTLTQESTDNEAFRRVLETNVLGMVHTFQPFVQTMLDRKHGKLVGIASVAGIRGLPGAGAYSASKAAAITYLESLRVELRDTGVKVITIAPGYIATPMTAQNDYAMPFMLPAAEAARRFARAIEKGSSYSVIPWQMGIVAKLLRLLPNSVFDFFASRAGRKPRGLPL